MAVSTDPNSAIITQQGNGLVTAAVPPIGLAEELRQAADAIRSGRIDTLTVDCRARLSAACDSAARLLDNPRAAEARFEACTRCRRERPVPGGRRCATCILYMRNRNRTYRSRSTEAS